MKQSNNKGASTLSAIVIVVVVVILLGFFAYIILRNGKISLPEYSSVTPQPETSTQELEVSEVSDSDEVEVIEKELDETTEGSFDSDFENLDEEASSL